MTNYTYWVSCWSWRSSISLHDKKENKKKKRKKRRKNYKKEKKEKKGKYM